ncbi:MAG TPA: hypothetical protein VFA27_17975 [Vicinamibacterales bacterium]|nr:hypothetical protein [Vicinamibacterales bacterium]
MVYRRTGRDASTSCLASMEVVDAAGGTTGFTNPGVLVGFNPQPDPPGDFVSR